MTFPTDWCVTTLGQAGQWLSGGTPSTTEPAFWGGDIPWIGSGSLTQFHISDSERRVTELGAANGTRIVGPGTVLMVVRGMSLLSEFRMGLTARTVAFGQDCKALLPRSDLDALFLAYALKAKTSAILDLVDRAGHGTGRLNMDQLAAQAIGVPGIREQRDIAATLGALDDKIESNRRLINICSALLDAMSSSFVLDVDSVPLSHLAEPIRDTFDPSSLGTELIDHFSIPAFDAQGLPDRTTGASVISAKLRVDRPAVLVSRLNPKTNRTWFAVPEPGVSAGCSTEFLVLAPKAGVTLGSLWLAVRDEGFRSLLAQRVTGTSGSHQRVKPLDALATEVPDVRQLLAADVQAADELLSLMHQRRIETTKLAALRHALLPELLSGRIRVPEAGEAVESALA